MTKPIIPCPAQDPWPGEKVLIGPARGGEQVVLAWPINARGDDIGMEIVRI